VIAAARLPIGPPSPRQHEKCAYERHRFIEVHIERKGMRLARLVASPKSFSSEGGALGVDSGVETFVPPKAIILQ